LFAREFPELPESVPRDRIPIFKHQTNKELYYQQNKLSRLSIVAGLLGISLDKAITSFVP